MTTETSRASAALRDSQRVKAVRRVTDPITVQPPRGLSEILGTPQTNSADLQPEPDADWQRHSRQWSRPPRVEMTIADRHTSTSGSFKMRTLVLVPLRADALLQDRQVSQVSSGGE